MEKLNANIDVVLLFYIGYKQNNIYIFIGIIPKCIDYKNRTKEGDKCIHVWFFEKKSLTIHVWSFEK